MGGIMDKLDLSSLQKAIIALDDAFMLVNNQAWFEQQNEPLQKTLIAGLIQHFEFVYELSVKMLKRRLEMDFPSTDEIDHANFRDLLRIAAEYGLIEDVSHWFDYRKMRNITSHTYDEDKAHHILQGIEGFLPDAKQLLQQLEQRNCQSE